MITLSYSNALVKVRRMGMIESYDLDNDNKDYYYGLNKP